MCQDEGGTGVTAWACSVQPVMAPCVLVAVGDGGAGVWTGGRGSRPTPGRAGCVVGPSVTSGERPLGGVGGGERTVGFAHLGTLLRGALLAKSWSGR